MELGAADRVQSASGIGSVARGQREVERIVCSHFLNCANQLRTTVIGVVCS
jgi:hypothetical protein